jgi:hypothetical protein
MAIADVLLGTLFVLVIGGVGGFIGAKIFVARKFNKIRKEIPIDMVQQINPTEVNNGNTKTSFFSKFREAIRRRKNKGTEDIRREPVIERTYSNNTNEREVTGQERVQIQQADPITTEQPVARREEQIVSRTEQNPKRDWESTKQDTSWREN